MTAALITVNWGTYVWAIATDRALETALGYYINPLFSVFLGAVVLGEKLSRAQIGAIVLAAVGRGAAGGGNRRAALGIADARVSWPFMRCSRRRCRSGRRKVSSSKC